MNRTRGVFVVIAVGAILAGGLALFFPWWLDKQSSWPVTMISVSAISPSGDHIAFVVTRQGGKDHQIDTRVAILSLPTMQLRQTPAQVIMGLAWSGDGDTLVLVSGQSDRPLGLDALDLQTTVVTSISPPSCWTPRLSPDGRLLGFVRNDDLAVRDMQTSEEIVAARNVDRWSWCWASDGTRVFYVRGKQILSSTLNPGGDESVIYTDPSTDALDRPEHLTPSPDGLHLGFHRTADDSFNSLDLRTGRTAVLFHSDHYFQRFLWVPDGIVYLDAHEGERRSSARLMYYDVASQESREAAIGPFSFISSFEGRTVLLRYGSLELWRYDLDTGKGQPVVTERMLREDL